MATHLSILAGEIPWTEKPGGQQSMGLHRVGHDWANTHNVWIIQPLFIVSITDHPHSDT